eukprot:XP_025979846.1 uncharacterized protein LOC100820165 isoform X2 [Glycine max]
MTTSLVVRSKMGSSPEPINFSLMVALTPIEKGPYITTSYDYDYDAPLDEYGNIVQPKWGHLNELHSALKAMEEALTSRNVTETDVGNSVKVNERLDVKHDDPVWGENVTLRINNGNHVIHAFVNGEHIDSHWATYGIHNDKFDSKIKLKHGTNTISLLSVTVGLQKDVEKAKKLRGFIAEKRCAPLMLCLVCVLFYFFLFNIRSLLFTIEFMDYRFDAFWCVSCAYGTLLEPLTRAQTPVDPSDIAIRLLEPLKAEFPILSYADFYPVMFFCLWCLCA